MHLVKYLHIATPNGLHHFGKTLVLLRREQQVQMVGHQHVGVNIHPLLSAVLLE